MAKKQSKKEKEVIAKFKKDTNGMTSSQIFEYMKLSEVEKEMFVQKFIIDHGIKLPVSHANHVDKRPLVVESTVEKNPSSSSTKKEREKGFRSARIWNKGNNAISHECKCSNDLRNSAQYIERSNYFENEKLRKKGIKISKKDRYISYQDLDKLKDKVEFVDDNGIKKDKFKVFREAYKNMSMACLSQQTLVLVTDSWDSHYEGLFGYLKGDPNYTGKPNIPGYGDKGGEYIVVIPNDRFKIVAGQDIEKSWSGIDKNVINTMVNTLSFEPALSYLKLDGLETTLTEKDDIRELRIVPAGVGYFIEIVYKLREGDRKKELLKDKNGDQIILNPNIIGGIDLGLRNIVTKGFVEIINDVNGNESGKVIGQPICFKGGVLKSQNQYYNKRRSEIQSIYEHQAKGLKKKLRHLKFQYNVKTKNDNSPKYIRDQLYKEIQSIKGELKKIRTGPALRKLEFKRNNKMMDEMHKYSRWIINDSIDNKSGTLVIGHNKGQKQSIDLGGITNQNFVFIPFYKLIKMIEYKGEEVGIKVIIREESHTSKCSVTDWESVEHHDKYVGKRISRGLFKSKNEIIINADVQGYINIIRKEFPKINKIDGIEGVRLHPVRVNPLMSRAGQLCSTVLN